jgi:NADH-quinone oxidoreductase subunit N
MEAIEYIFLLPLIVLASGSVMTLLAIAIYRNHQLIFSLSVLSMILFLVSIIYTWKGLATPYHVSDLLVIDNFTLFYFALCGCAGLLILLISYPYLSQQNIVKEEYYVLLQTSVFGAVVLVASDHFVSLFLGLEILSISLYSIIAYIKTRAKSIEAGLKYLILAAASSAFLLFGMALVYTETGSLSFSKLSIAFQDGGFLSTAGLALMLVGIGFKLAVVPFHTWTPDVYQGASTPVSALIATISKGSMVALLLRFLHMTGGFDIDWLVWAFSLIAIASMLFGNILALRQDNIKRLLAYSSIAHLGYILVAIVAGTSFSIEAVTFYIVAYFVAVLGAFGALSLLSTSEYEIEQIEDLRGLFWTRPVLAILFSAMFFSLVGIPLTVGFMGKFYVVLSAISNDMWLLAFVLVLSSAIGLYYYLRVIKTMLSQIKEDAPPTLNVERSRLGILVLSVLGILLVWFGVFPSELIQLIESAIY